MNNWTEPQLELLQNILNLPEGTIIKRGTVERIFCGNHEDQFIVYKTKRSKTKAIALNYYDFIKWAEKAEIVLPKEN